jgi:phosphoglycerol transferase MdoB-like AlkP superfamily enzyme
MKKIIYSFLRQYLFWVLFFDFTRIIFLLYNIRIIWAEKIGLLNFPGLFWYSIKLDVATASYIMVIPFLLLLIQSAWSPKWLNHINKVYTGVLIFAYSLTSVGEMGIYPEWKTKLSYKVLKYFDHPSEIYNSAGTGPFIFLLVLLVFLFLAGYYAYIKVFYVNIIREKFRPLFTLGMLILVPPLILISMRGGIQAIPINQSQSFYSKYNILNLSSVNNFFNLYISIFENLPNFHNNPYVFMDPAAAKKLVQDIYRIKKDTTISILKNSRPNIVILILESWSADLIEDLGGKPGITPEFKELERNGILFDSIYSSGARSEQGMASIFSAFPAHPVSCITVQPDKFVKLQSLPQLLKKQGYRSSFYFGGQLIYGNIKSYIYFNGFERIMEGSDFPSSIPRGKLGIHDQFTLSRMLEDLNREPQPFLSALFTVSTHAPWDQPYPKPLKWGDNEREYINAALYTDHCLGDYFRQAAKEPWFDNTLFIIVADHSHNSYRNWHPQSKQYHKIPLLFYGNVIRDEYKGTIWHKLGNQHDIAATLLAQMGLPHEKFTWSKNLFNPYSPDFAYFSTDDGVGWIRPDCWFSYDKKPDYYNFFQMKMETKDSVLREGKAYLQVVFSEYMND